MTDVRAARSTAVTVGAILAVVGLAIVLWFGLRTHKAQEVRTERVVVPEGNEGGLTQTEEERQVVRQVQCVPLNHWVGKAQPACEPENVDRLNPVKAGLVVFGAGAVVLIGATAARPRGHHA